MESHYVAMPPEPAAIADPAEEQQRIEKSIFNTFELRTRKKIYGEQADFKTPLSTPARLKITFSKPLLVTTQDTIIIHDDRDNPPMLGGPAGKRLTRPECDILANILSRQNKTCFDRTTKWAAPLSIAITIALFASKTLDEDDYGAKFLLGIIFIAGIRVFYQLHNHWKSATVDDHDLSADVVDEFLREQTAFAIIATRDKNTDENFRTIISACAPRELKNPDLGNFETNALDVLDQCKTLTDRIRNPNKNCLLNKIPSFYRSTGFHTVRMHQEIEINHPKPAGANWTQEEIETIAWLPTDSDFPRPRRLGD